eukprot:3338370-Karenia_brevis.AAC.1
MLIACGASILWDGFCAQKQLRILYHAMVVRKRYPRTNFRWKCKIFGQELKMRTYIVNPAWAKGEASMMEN